MLKINWPDAVEDDSKVILAFLHEDGRVLAGPYHFSAEYQGSETVLRWLHENAKTDDTARDFCNSGYYNYPALTLDSMETFLQVQKQTPVRTFIYRGEGKWEYID